MKVRILSYEYLQWQIRQLSALVKELDPHNLHRLLKAMDSLETLIEELMEILELSGNKASTLYEMASIVEKKSLALKEQLEELPEEDEALELGVIRLQRALHALAKALQTQSAVTFPFSMN